MHTDYDILIIGGGLVGASLAAALGGRSLRVAMIEAVPFSGGGQPGYDDRAIALAQGTQRIFNALGAWDFLAPGGEVTPIHQIHVSDRGRFGFTRLNREEEGVPALGYVAPARALGAALVERLQQLPDLELISPATVQGLQIDEECARVQLAVEGGERTITSRLVVAADGARSTVRELMQVPVTEWDYGQCAVIANVTPAKPHANVAYERFTDTGPLAMLPMGDQRCAVVWTVQQDKVEAIMELNDRDFLGRVQERFGFRLGRLQHAGKRNAYPLRLVRARESVRPRLALIGNAVHALHPIAGQGFNLGLRDVAALAEVLVDGIERGADPGNIQVLDSYARWRQSDHRRVTAFTDGLARLFVNPLPGVGVLRDAGMLALDLMPPVKHGLSRITMGRSGRLPRLARGLPL